MKKCLFLLLSLLLVSCAASGRNSRNNLMASLFNSENISSIHSSNITSESSLESSSLIMSSDSSSNSAPVYDKVDVDLTEMNATLVYSQVNNMMNNPSEYRQKIIKMSGPFRPYESVIPDYCYPAIIIKDATACCATGIEFLLYDTPRCTMEGGNGYPLYDEEATIVGRFETYLEGTHMYMHLVDALWLK